jgi:queuosine precursor transporter
MDIGAPYRSRTCGLKIRSLALYPAELRARAKGRNNGFARPSKARYAFVMTTNPIEAQSASSAAHHQFRYYDLVMAAFVAILLLSNIIGASKRSVVDLPFIGEWPFGAGVLFFPLSYVIGDMLTEVYGYARARRVIWTGFGALIFMAFMAWVVVLLPPADGWPHQAAYEAVFGNSWRIVLASMLAFWAGEFANSFVLAKMKIANKGKNMGLRFVASTFVGQGLDSLIFYPVAFYGLDGWPTQDLFKTVVSQWAIKTGWEIILLPITIMIVTALKRREGVDLYDDTTDFTPFRAKL